MAVFTRLATKDVGDFVKNYPVGEFVEFKAISEGIENSNFFVSTQDEKGREQRWVLTIFETLPASELSYFCELTQFLGKRKFQVPAPVKTSDGASWLELKDKPAVLVPRLPGGSYLRPDAAACEQIGQWLARMHNALAGFKPSRPLERHLGWMQTKAVALAVHLAEPDAQLLNQSIKRYEDYHSVLAECPQGTVHGDLFRDNVLFEQGKITGVIDFYHACNATLLFDLAVVANDWTTDAEGCHEPGRLQALLDGYQSERSWQKVEKLAWPFCMELAALRFWISRLSSLHLPGYQQQTVSGDALKDPDEMKRILLNLEDREV